MAGKLTLVGTPIGNLGDLSPRARRALEEADFIAAEDTRVTLKLLNHFGISRQLVSYYQHNKERSGERILERILAGENCALVTDAGMPAVSDPGEDLAVACAERGIHLEKEPRGTPGLAPRRKAHDDLLRGPAQAAKDALGPCRRLRPRAPRRPLPGAHQAARAGPAHDPGRGCPALRGGTAAGRVRTSRRGRGGGPGGAAHGGDGARKGKILPQRGPLTQGGAKLAAADTGYSKNELYELALRAKD